jgi:hypothetical protein
MPSFIYRSCNTDIAKKLLDLSSDALKCALLASSYTPDKNAHTKFSDVSAAEITASGYTPGGQALTTVTLTEGVNKTVLDADDPVWNPVTITARYAVIYQATGTPSTSRLVCLLDFGADKQDVAGRFGVTFNAAGICEWDV